MLISSHFTFDNEGMKSSKCHVTSLLSLIFLLKCISKSTTSLAFNFLLIAASESLDRKKVDTAEDNLKKMENDESGDGKHSDEKQEHMEKSEANVETYPPFFRESDQGSSRQEQCKTSSIIPDPPSSPSLTSLEEDENTPSLGLEDNDWVTYHS